MIADTPIRIRPIARALAAPSPRGTPPAYLARVLMVLFALALTPASVALHERLQAGQPGAPAIAEVGR